MKFERSDIKFPLWRKKVDSSLFNKMHTPIPNWCAEIWNIEKIFGINTSRKNPESLVQIKFEGNLYDAWVTYSNNKDTDYQIFLSKEIVHRFKDRYIMSYMRSLEQKLRKGNLEYSDIDLEKELPFWEFLDIEFDPANKLFICKAHYYQKPIFPELFKQFTQSHLLSQIENKLDGKGEFKFIKEDWKPKSALKSILEKQNIIYYLLDSKNALLYIGEAEHTRRIGQVRKEIPAWDYFRIDCLPVWLSRTQRLELERLLIRSYAAVMTNYKSIKNIPITEYRLVNKKIDR